MTEKEYSEKMFAEYHEICELRNGEVVSLETKDYGRLKSTLDILEMGGYIRDLNIDGGHIYALDETFEYFETNMNGFEVKSGDIIVSCAGTIGETFILPDNIEKGIINQALMRIRLFNSVNKTYFLIYFDYIIKKEAQQSSKGSAIKNIPPFDVFKQMLFPVPPIQEQQRIIQKLSKIMETIEFL